MTEGVFYECSSCQITARCRQLLEVHIKMRDFLRWRINELRAELLSLKRYQDERKAQAAENRRLLEIVEDLENDLQMERADRISGGDRW